jgi:hypothetical protein
MLTERQRRHRDEIIDTVRGAGGFPVSWPNEPTVRFEILDEDIGQQLVNGFAGYGMRGVYLGSLTRVIPGGIADCFAYEVRLPREQKPPPVLHGGERASGKKRIDGARLNR